MNERIAHNSSKVVIVMMTSAVVVVGLDKEFGVREPLQQILLSFCGVHCQLALSSDRSSRRRCRFVSLPKSIKGRPDSCTSLTL